MKKSRIISALTMIAVVFAQLPVIFAASGYTNPNLESLFFVDKYGNTILEPDGMNVIPYVVLSKTEEASDMGGTVLVGTYTADGGLYSAQTIEVGAGSSVFNEKAHLLDRWTIAGEEMSYPEGGYARAFWWDSFESMTPNTPSNDDIMAAKSSWTGELVLPEPFKGLLAGVTITKDNGVRNYTHNAEPQSFYDWSSAETVYISAEGMADGLGGTAETAITMPCFEKNYNSGAYGSQRDFIITVMDDIYSGTPSDAIVVGTEGALGSGINLKSSINALIRSGSENGFTWMGQKHENASVSESSGIYKAALSSGTNVIPVNLNALDAYGMPLSYNLVSSLDDCKAQKGTYYQQENGTEVYFNLFEGENFQDISFFELLPKMITGRNYIGNLMFENIGFMPNAINDRYNGIVGGSYADTRIGFFGCKFYRSAHNTLAMQGKYTVFVFDCVNAYGARDGFNYHAENDSVNDKYSTAIEVNSISYKQGSFNQMYGSEKDTNSNNASTGHDGMNILRIGGRYWQAEGPIVADGNCFTVNIGCEAYNFVTTSPSERSAFMAHNNEPAVRGGKLPNKYFIDCLGTGVKIRAGIVSSENSYVLDFKGNEILGLGSSGTQNPLKSITWEEIAAGGIEMYESEPEPEPAVYKSSDAYLTEQQGSDGWNFQYVSIDENDYTDFDTFEDGWVAEFSGNWDYGAVMSENTIHPGSMYDVSKTFTCPKDGTVKLTSEDAIKLAAENSDGVNLKVLKNDTQLWPDNGWQLCEYGTESEFEPVTVDVKAGDKIYFRANCNGSNIGDTTYWSPVVEYTERVVKSFTLSDVKTEYTVGDSIDRAAGTLLVVYEDGGTAEIPFSDADVEVSGFDSSSIGVKTITVVYKGITGTYDIDVAAVKVKEVYNAYNDMSKDQGSNSWYYKYVPFGKYRVSDYTEYEYYENGFWMNTEKDFSVGRIRMNDAGTDISTGSNADAALIFSAPAAGTINLSMADNTITELSSNDITRLRIYKNEEQVFPAAADSWLELAKDDIYNFDAMDIKVSAGDEIIFRVNKGVEGPNIKDGEIIIIGNGGDKLKFVPIIKYTEISEEKKVESISVSNPKQEYNIGDVMDRSVGKLAIVYDDETTDEISFGNPRIAVSGFDTASAGAKTITVTYMGISTTFDINVAAVLYKTEFNAFNDFSGDQGKNNWYYKYAPLGKFGAADYKELGYYGDGFWLYADGDWQNGRIRMSAAGRDISTGSGGDPALVFKAPVGGTINVSMDGGNIKELSSDDITRFRIYKNEQQIFPLQEGEWCVMVCESGNYNSEHGTQYPSEIDFEAMNITVNAGDEIIFRVNKGIDGPNIKDELGNTILGNAGDKLQFVPVINYIEQ